ncbi:hypothetical protein [Streptomyces sp. NPDC093598]|uniref:ATP-dependent DNA ligase n=1 Tax=Streptomyces sp. NPDC093598 TaxID=3366046 RepID=UPI0037F356E2
MGCDVDTAGTDARRPCVRPCAAAGWAGEPKWDGYRAPLAVYAGGRVLLRSRRGTDMTASFPEIRAATLAQLPTDTGIDGELVVRERDGLAFQRLQQRLARRGAAAAQAARQWPAAASRARRIARSPVTADGCRSQTAWLSRKSRSPWRRKSWRSSAP